MDKITVCSVVFGWGHFDPARGGLAASDGLVTHLACLEQDLDKAIKEVFPGYPALTWYNDGNNAYANFRVYARPAFVQLTKYELALPVTE